MSGTAVEHGAPPELKQSPLAEAEKIASYQPPMELLDRSRFAKVNKSCLATNRFVLAWSEVRPFDRLRFLRGSEAALVDLARGTKEVRDLLAMLHDFNCKEIELWAETEVDGVAFRDDWGSAEGLLIAPEMWREIFRPLYREYCKILHAKDKFVFFHSDGHIGDIFSDLVKVGIDAIHSQLHLMDAERLTKRFRGRVTFWGGHGPQAAAATPARWTTSARPCRRSARRWTSAAAGSSPNASGTRASASKPLPRSSSNGWCRCRCTGEGGRMTKSE